MLRCSALVVPDLFASERPCGAYLQSENQGGADERWRCPTCGATWSDGKSPDGAGDAAGGD